LIADTNRRRGRRGAKLERFLLWRDQHGGESWQAVRGRVMRSFGKSPSSVAAEGGDRSSLSSKS
jgi:hypothetical protein